ncbi:protein takeout-like [Ischnura elegans]|uniref:protein takeout-like n=1 Tax=Ischnura elegans TaxID=197161 RepID=UPI001ED88A0A|nr:protein takeout-like [Ischnura elegans]
MRSAVLCLVAALALVSVVDSRRLPSYVKVCKRTDKNLNKCLMDAVATIRPYLLKGIPEFKIPPYDPLEIPVVTLTQGTGAVSYNATFRNLKAYGARDAIVKDVKIDLEDLKLEFDLLFPRMHLESDYDVDGKVLVVPVKGNGPSNANFTNTETNIKLYGKFETKEGKKYISLKEREVSLSIGDARLYFGNLFNGNKELGDSTNQFFNDNWRDIVKEIQPVVEETISTIIHEIVRKVFELYTFDELLPES